MGNEDFCHCFLHIFSNGWHILVSIVTDFLPRSRKLRRCFVITDEVDIEEERAARNCDAKEKQGCNPAKKRAEFTSKAEQDGAREDPNVELQEFFLKRIIARRQLVKLSVTVTRPKIGKVNKDDKSYDGSVVVAICAINCAKAANCEVQRSQLGDQKPEVFIAVIGVAPVAMKGKSMFAATIGRHFARRQKFLLSISGSSR